MNIIKLKMTFKRYVETFDTKDKMIMRKYYHSHRVMKLAKQIACQSKFTNNDIQLSTIAGLLHDYGRFIQWTTYHTYDDLKSIDHGDLAVKLLFPNEIKKYILEEAYYYTIYDAIKYHNKLALPYDLSLHSKSICNVVRDADKLDIFYLWGLNKIPVIEDNIPITAKVEQDFMNYKSINLEDVKCKADLILLRLAMVFDLNFKYSYKYMKEHKLIKKIYVQIENKQQFQKYFEIVQKHIDEKIKT